MVPTWLRFSGHLLSPYKERIEERPSPGKDSNSSTTGPTAATNATKTATPSSPGSSAEAFPLSYLRHSFETSTPVPRAASKT